MPNWVYNNMTVSGEAKDLIAFRDKASKIAPHGITEDGVLEYKDDNASDLSFWNFIEPENKALYFGASDYKPEGYEKLSMEERMVIAMKHSSEGWYDWNVNNWGTKWDAGDATLMDLIETLDQHLYYNFQTAWSIPEQIFRAMCEQHPELEFQFSSEEEQGWGAEYTSSEIDGAEDGEPTSALLLVNEWEIPNSHADYVERDREDSCCCSWEEDEDEWYKDCPRSEQTFAVVVEQVFFVKAGSAEKAWELADEKLSGLVLDLGEQIAQSDDNTMFVRDMDSNERLFPKADLEFLEKA